MIKSDFFVQENLSLEYGKVIVLWFFIRFLKRIWSGKRPRKHIHHKQQWQSTISDLQWIKQNTTLGSIIKCFIHYDSYSQYMI